MIPGCLSLAEVRASRWNRWTSSLSNFFFQAEDGIRDRNVTGVQTCALPILIYAPGNYASTEELIALAKVAARSGGIYASHIRNEGDSEMEALDEAFRIGREANIDRKSVV